MDNSNSYSEKSIDIYIFHTRDAVVLGLYFGDKLLNHMKIPKSEIGEKWVESFSYVIRKLRIGIANIRSIYLNSSFSTWNASRLITLFAKTFATHSDVSLYLREESQDKLDADSSLKSFHKDRKSFRFVESPISIVPNYKKCQGINT